MKKILFLAFLFFSVTACFGQGFDKDMIKAGKEFNKHSKRVGQAPPRKSKRVSTLNGGKAKAKKKNRARRKSNPAKKD